MDVVYRLIVIKDGLPVTPSMQIKVRQHWAFVAHVIFLPNENVSQRQAWLSCFSLAISRMICRFLKLPSNFTLRLHIMVKQRYTWLDYIPFVPHINVS